MRMLLVKVLNKNKFFLITKKKYVIIFMPQFKVLTHILPLKEAKNDFHRQVFEEMVNEHLQAGWKIIGCESTFLSGVSPKAGIHYWAYLLKE